VQIAGPLGFSRQSNHQADEGSHHPDRNAQFEYINKKVVTAQAKRQPVISVLSTRACAESHFWGGSGLPHR
jgi:hypothetical protein